MLNNHNAFHSLFDSYLMDLYYPRQIGIIMASYEIGSMNKPYQPKSP